MVRLILQSVALTETCTQLFCLVTGEWTRFAQFAKLYLFAPSSGLFSCPLAMTDGAATLMGIMNKDISKVPAAARADVTEAYKRVISTDPEQFWTSGQWMTERGGGSDVGDGQTTLPVVTLTHTRALTFRFH